MAALHVGACGHVGVARHGADDQALPSRRMPGQLGDAAQVDDLFRVGQAQAHRRQQALPTGQQLAAWGRSAGELRR
jgi:hypothetical protein